MIATTGIIPENLMRRELKSDVVNWLLAAPYPGYFKRRLLEGWAITVGIRVRPIDYARVQQSGVDEGQA